MRCSSRLLLLLIITTALPSVARPSPPSNDLLKTYSSQIYFEENSGQFDTAILFQSYVTQIQIRFLENGVSTAMFRELETGPKSTTRKHDNYQWAGEKEAEHEALVWNNHFINISPEVKIKGKDPIPGVIHYLKGNDPQKWVKNALRYRELWYESIYDHIDLRYYGTQNNQLKYDFILLPGADISQIGLRPEGIVSLEITDQEELVIHTKWGEVTDAAPYAYQIIGGEEIPVSVQYIIRNSQEVGFEITGSYDPAHPLVLDPVTMSWSTFFHSSTSDDYVIAVDRDSQDYVYLTGYTKSLVFPITTGVYQNVYGGGIDCYVSKMDPNATSLVYSTFIGGLDWELAYAIGVTSSKEPVISGYVRSTDYPTTTGSFQPVNGGGLVEGFVTRLSQNGDSLIYSTFLGGIDRDYIYDMALNSLGEVYLTGYTLSSDFPVTAGAYSGTMGGNGDIFVTKLSADGSSLGYSTLVSGTNYDIANCIVINNNGDAFVGGNTGSADLPATPGVVKDTFTISPSGTPEDAFILRLNNTGSSLMYLTYLGGGDSDAIYDLAVNSNDDVFATGVTYSSDYPTTPGAYQDNTSPTLGSGDLFVTKINAAGTNLEYSTLLGGSDVDFCKSIEINANNEAHILGATRSSNFPTTSNSAAYSAMYDILVSVINPDGTSLIHSALLGGSYNEYPRAAGGLILRGNKLTLGVTTHSPNVPMTSGTYQGAKTNGVNDAPWIVGLEINTVLPVELKHFSANPGLTGQFVQLDWETTLETDVVIFEIERRLPDQPWKIIGRVQGKGELLQNYSFQDTEIGNYSGQTLLYRLRYEGYDGEIHHSLVRQVKIPANRQARLNLYPNPAATSFKMAYQLYEDRPVRIEILDSGGKTIYRSGQKENLQKDELMVRHLDISSWSAGIYFVRLIPADGIPVTRKLVVQH